jgi:hypothetical protein
MAMELKQLEMNKKIVNEAVSAGNLSEVDYDELEVIRARKEYEFVEKERTLLGEYLERMQGDVEERQGNDERRVQVFREEKISRLQMNISEVTKYN